MTLCLQTPGSVAPRATAAFCPPGKTALIKFRDCKGKAILPNVRKLTGCFCVTHRNKESTWGNTENVSSLYFLAPYFLLKMMDLPTISFLFQYLIFLFHFLIRLIFSPRGTVSTTISVSMFSLIKKKWGNKHLIYTSVTYLKNNCETVIRLQEWWRRHQSSETVQREEQKAIWEQLPWWVVPRRYSSHEQLWSQFTRARQLRVSNSQRDEHRSQISSGTAHSWLQDR